MNEDPSGPRRGWARRLDRTTAPYLYVAPFFVIFFAFGLFPLVYTAWVSLHRVSLSSPQQMDWVGFHNYSALLHNEFFWNALRNTITLGLLSTVPQLCLALGLAHLLNSRLRGRTFFRVAMLLPNATSVAAATLVFANLFGRDFGLINWVLHLLGVHPIAWESGRWTSQLAISTIVTWRWTGYNALIYLAAMQTIDSDLLEAAAIDGASEWQRFRHVTIPGLRPTILFTAVVSSIGATQLFGEPLLFGGVSGHLGGAGRQYQTLGLLLYDTGWFNQKLGQAAAIAWLMFALIVILVGIAALIIRRISRGTPFGRGDALVR
ncbi:MAG: transporter permease [Frankiales bacterium]|nr:transporter permease [Frankiales bacterium]